MPRWGLLKLSMLKSQWKLCWLCRCIGHILRVNSKVTHICVDNLTTIRSDNGLSPGRCQAIIWTNVGILLIEPFRTNFSEILVEIMTFSFKKMYLKVSSAKWRPFCLGLNMLIFARCQSSYAVIPCKSEYDTPYVTTVFIILENKENDGTEEIVLMTPHPMPCNC